MKNNRLKNAKAITLIALIVTIIVLLILAGISIAALTGNNGVLNNASIASTKNAYEGAEEKVKIAYTAVRTEIMAKTVESGTYNPTSPENTRNLANIVRKDLGLAENSVDSNGTWKVDDTTAGVIKIEYRDSKIDQGVMGLKTITKLGDLAASVAIPREEGVVHYQINLLEEQNAKLYVDVMTDIEPVHPTSIDVSSEGDATSIEVDDTLQFYATPHTSSGKTTTDTIAWNSSDTSVATIDANGLVTALAAGTTNITAIARDNEGDHRTSQPFTLTVTQTQSSSGIPEGLKIGSLVTYDPSITTSKTSHTSNWSADLCSTVLTADRTLDISGTGNNNMAITSWRVLSIDETNETVELISTTPSPNTLYLGQAQGYNNAVYLLNKACDELYGGTLTKGGASYTIEGRNLNIKDIEDRMTEEALTTGEKAAHSYGSIATWGNRRDAYTSNKNYPLIYAQEEGSIIDGAENTNRNALKLWEQTTPIARSASSSGDGEVSTATSIQPKQTYWSKDNSFMQTAFKAPEGLNETDGTTNTNYDLLMTDGSASWPVYWLASRCVDISTRSCYFQVSSVGGGGVYGGIYLFTSSGSTSRDGGALRPVVSLSAGLITENEDGFQVGTQN